MFTKPLLLFLAFLVFAGGFFFDHFFDLSFVDEAKAAYDPTSQAWGSASVTTSSSGCVTNRFKSGNGLPWFSCVRAASGTITLTFTPGFFPFSPICQLTAVGLPLVFGFASDPTTTSATINMLSILNVASDGTFFIGCR